MTGLDAGELDATIPLVIASGPDCAGLRKAERAGIRTEVVSRGAFADAQSFSDRIFGLLRDANVDLVTLAVLDRQGM